MINETDLSFENLSDYDVYHLNSWENNIDDRLKLLLSHLNLSDLNDEETTSIISICRKYNDVFHLEGDSLPAATAAIHNIPLKVNTNPIYQKPYRMPESMKTEIHRQVQEMLTNDIIEESDSPWNFPLLAVPKKSEDGSKKWRIVVDFRRLNDVTVDRVFPLPNISEILDQLGRAVYFSTLDLSNGFHQVLLDGDDKNKTAFSTSYGHYHFKRIPFGLKGAPSTFQHMMNKVLSGLNGVKCSSTWMILLFMEKTLLDHNQKLEEIFNCLRQNSLKLNPRKCQFLKK